MKTVLPWKWRMLVTCIWDVSFGIIDNSNRLINPLIPEFVVCRPWAYFFFKYMYLVKHLYNYDYCICFVTEKRKVVPESRELTPTVEEAWWEILEWTARICPMSSDVQRILALCGFVKIQFSSYLTFTKVKLVNWLHCLVIVNLDNLWYYYV